MRSKSKRDEEEEGRRGRGEEEEKDRGVRGGGSPGRENKPGRSASCSGMYRTISSMAEAAAWQNNGGSNGDSSARSAPATANPTHDHETQATRLVGSSWPQDKAALFLAAGGNQARGVGGHLPVSSLRFHEGEIGVGAVCCGGWSWEWVVGMGAIPDPASPPARRYLLSSPLITQRALSLVPPHLLPPVLFTLREAPSTH